MVGWLCVRVACVCVCIGNMGVWLCGGVVMWSCGCVIVCCVWLCVCNCMRGRGWADVVVCGCVLVCVCNYGCGCVLVDCCPVVWLCGCVVA